MKYPKRKNVSNWLGTIPFHFFRLFLATAWIGASLAGCGKFSAYPASVDEATFQPTSTATPFQPLPEGMQSSFDNPALQTANNPVGQSTAVPAESEGAAATLVSSPTERTLWIDPLLPASLLSAISPPSGWSVVENQVSSVQIQYSPIHPLSYWIFAVVASFPTIPDEISSAEIKAAWQGSPSPTLGRNMILDQSSHAALSSLWGVPADNAVQVVSAGELLDTAWNRADTWAIVPFEELNPKWKVLSVDGISPVHNDFLAENYALRIPISLLGDGYQVDSILIESSNALHPLLPDSNRDPSRLTVLAMTGVTALVRATATTMDRLGFTYPAEDIHDWLAYADLTHISNEVPFAQDCPPPDAYQQNVVFCSNPAYMELLEYIGTDIVELTGDHFADFGTEPMRYTLQLYKDHGWLYYGGGYNQADGQKPAAIEHNGNRLAFIGCNGKGGTFASASANSPGSASCDFDYMETEIKRLRAEGYLPIATFQHFEYYTYYAQPAQEKDFQRLADAGAIIVSGSQAHQPQGMEFYRNAFLHYGLGNLFFDQYLLGEPMRQGFIDRHIFYDGRYISTELLTIYFIDFARPRPMSTSERANLLLTVFSASGW